MNLATRRCVFTFFVLCSGAFLLSSAGVAFAQPGHGCHAPFTIPGYPRDMAYNAVQVMHRERTTCQTALHVAAKAWTTPGLQIKWGPQFGGGGYGGPFHVGRWHCYLLSRGSDFKNAKCSRGQQAIRFYDHRQYWQIPEPGWKWPPLTP